MTVRENERNRLVTAVDFAAHCGSNNRHSFFIGVIIAWWVERLQSQILKILPTL